jgi:hypothetical protein
MASSRGEGSCLYSPGYRSRNVAFPFNLTY